MYLQSAGDPTQASERMDPPGQIFRTAFIALVMVFAFAWFANLELRGLFIPDEARYAEIPREILASGDWVTPRLDGLKYLEKPPLEYWLTAASFAAFGEDEWTARLPSALLGFLSIAMTGFTASRLWTRRAGILSGVVLGSSWGFYLCGQYLTLDMTLSAFLTLALCAFLLAQRDNAKSRENRSWMLVAWVGIALAVLAKGLVALVLPAIAIVVYTTWSKNFVIWRRLHLAKGFALVAAIALPWFLLMQQRNPEFFQFFFIHEHFQRFAENGHSRAGAWWYYLPIFILGFMPWTPALLYQIMRRNKEKSLSGTPPIVQFNAARFCIAWAGSIFLFFSVSHSKLPAYVIPMFPAIALALGYQLQHSFSTALKWCAWGAVSTGSLLLLGVSQLPHWHKFAIAGPEAVNGLPLLSSAAGILLLGGLPGIWRTKQKHPVTVGSSLVIGSFAFWAFIFIFMHVSDARFSSERLIDKITDGSAPFQPEQPFFNVGELDYSLPFYLRRIITIVDGRGELGPGIDAEPSKVIPSVAIFRNIWTALSGQAYAAMTPAEYTYLSGQGLPMYVVVRDDRSVIVSRIKPVRFIKGAKT